MMIATQERLLTALRSLFAAERKCTQPTLADSGELKPCPFCGGEAHIERRGNGRFSTIISCLDCGVTHESGDTADSVGNSWNHRATTATTDQLAAYVMEMAERVKEVRELVAEMELSR